jgi:hypothetical protein
MFSKRKLIFLPVVLATSLVMSPNQAVCAQEIPSLRRRDAKNSQQPREDNDRYIWRMIRTQHIQPSLLVWWLNPLDQPEPAVARQWRQMSGDTDGVYGLPNVARLTVGGEKNLKEFRKRWRSVTTPAGLGALYPKPVPGGPAIMWLPSAISGLAALDGMGEMWVRGTEEGVDNLRNLVQWLDYARQRVEYHVQLIELPQSVAQTLTHGKPTKRLTQSLAASVMNGENRTKLTTLIASKRATVVQSKLLST